MNVRSEVAVHIYGDEKVRTLLIDGQVHFIAADLCEVLGLGRVHDAVRGLDEDEKGADTIRTLGGAQTVTTVTEASMYSMVLRSRKPEAKAFKRWVTHRGAGRLWDAAVARLQAGEPLVARKAS
ncbi:BRO-N domain-containing protein [Glutamicibacter sp. X7]